MGREYEWRGDHSGRQCWDGGVGVCDLASVRYDAPSDRGAALQMIVLLATIALHSSLPTFTNWCALNGVIGLAPNGAISPATTPSSGLGLFAARTIKPGETLLRVPLRLALADRLLVGLDGASPKPPFKDAPWQASLAQRLSEAEDLSAPWLDILPKGVQGLSDESVCRYSRVLEPAIQ